MKTSVLSSNVASNEPPPLMSCVKLAVSPWRRPCFTIVIWPVPAGGSSSSSARNTQVLLRLKKSCCALSAIVAVPD